MTAAPDFMRDHNETDLDRDPFAPDRGRRGPIIHYFLFIAALFVAGQIVINAALFVRDTQIRGDMVDVFWAMEDARVAAGAAHEAAYYTPRDNRDRAAASVRTQLGKLREASQRISAVRERNALFARLDQSLLLRFAANVFLLGRFRQLELENAEQIAGLRAMHGDIAAMLQVYATTLGPRDRAALYEVKKREAAALKQYLRRRDSVARALEIPSRRDLRRELELKMEDRYKK